MDKQVLIETPTIKLKSWPAHNIFTTSNMIKEMSLLKVTLSTELSIIDLSSVTTQANNFVLNDSSSRTNATNFTEPEPKISGNDQAERSALDLTILCIKGLIFGSIILGAILGNSLVIISVHKNRKLR